MSLPRMAPTISSAGMPLRIVMASLGPIPLTVISFSKSCFSARPEKSIERDLIFANMRVDVQRDLAAESRQIGKCWDADSDVVTDAAGFNHGLVGMLGEQPSAKVSNHAPDIVAVRSCNGARLLFPIVCAVSPPRMRLSFYLTVMEVLAGLSLSLSYPLRWLSVDWTNILMAIASCEDEENPKDGANFMPG